jgi:hypothetical protein
VGASPARPERLCRWIAASWNERQSRWQKILRLMPVASQKKSSA